jgi:asparagine synthase (glutamine-hydrolysing)
MDEQWAGYDYYRRCLSIGEGSEESVLGPVQGSRQQSVRPDCLVPEFRWQAQSLVGPTPFPDALRNRQCLDTRYAKIPRAVRFNDRVSMRSSTELREPFLDHRLFELALRQPPERKIANGTHKRLLRQIAQALVTKGVVEAPKRPLQTPQREWLRGALKEWAEVCIRSALAAHGDAWLDRNTVQHAWQAYCQGASDNSFYVWQWINLALWEDCCLPASNNHF